MHDQISIASGYVAMFYIYAHSHIYKIPASLTLSCCAYFTHALVLTS